MHKIQIIAVQHINSQSEFHAYLKEVLQFPDFYGANWDAFWDTITGLVEMPRILEIQAWDILAKRLPNDAFQFLHLLDQAKGLFPNLFSSIRLISKAGQEINFLPELKRLQSL